MENCKLSTDLIVDILSRLPVKSLMRFKCVCKFVYDLVKSDHHFMDKHYEIRKAKTDCVLLEVGWPVRENYLLYKESEYNEIGCIYLDIPRTPRGQWVVKCCKGMLCLISTKNDILEFDSDYLIYDILILNPSIRKVKALHSVTVPYIAPHNASVTTEFGFGISNSMTLKVVMLLEICSSGERTVHQSTLVYSQVHGDSWSLKQIKSIISCKGLRNDFYLKGRYYWQAERYYKEYLIWFDMSDEVFGTITFPSDVIIVSVSIMNETIALLGYSRLDFNCNCAEIWLMIENDNNTYWRKQASIDPIVNGDTNIEYWAPIGIWNVDGELLVFLESTIDQHVPYFISVNLVTQEKKTFFISKERKSITMISNPTAIPYQVYNEKNIDIIEDFSPEVVYARVYDESLHLP